MELTHHESLQSSYISKYYGHRLGMSSGQSETGIGYVEAHQNTTPRKRARSLKIYVSVFKNVVSAELDTKWFYLKDSVSQLKLYSQPILVSTWAGCKGCCITILLLESPLFFRCFVRPTATESTALYIANVWKMLLLSSSVYNVFIIMMAIIIIEYDAIIIWTRNKKYFFFVICATHVFQSVIVKSAADHQVGLLASVGFDLTQT